MRRAPARPVRACFVRSCCADVVQEHDLRTIPGAMQRQANTFLTLHTALFTLHTCTSHPALHLISDHVSSSHLISPHLSSSHLIPSPLTCHLRKFFSTVFISSEHWSTFLISSKLFSTHLSCSSCSARQKALTVSTQKLETQNAFTLYTGKPSRKYLCTTKLSSSPHPKKVSLTHKSSCSNCTPRPYYNIILFTVLW